VQLILEALLILQHLFLEYFNLYAEGLQFLLMIIAVLLVLSKQRVNLNILDAQEVLQLIQFILEEVALGLALSPQVGQPTRIQRLRLLSHLSELDLVVGFSLRQLTAHVITLADEANRLGIVLGLQALQSALILA
jgi:hypothetical protein